MRRRIMPKGKLRNAEEITLQCLYCEKEFQFLRTGTAVRTACPECIPDDKGHDAALRRRLVKQKAVKYKGGRCEKCGVVYPYYIYDFHHINPMEKEFAIGTKDSPIKWDKVKSEIDKCLLVCSNCHREIHHQEQEDNAC